jgi:IPT/TIG domain.
MMRALISFFIAIPCAFAQLPGIAPGGIVEAASYSAPIAPGSLVTIFGNNLATSEITATSIPLPAVLGGTSVLVDGVSAPLLYVSPNQINLQLPSSLPFNQAAQVTVVTSSGSSAPAQVQFIYESLTFYGGRQRLWTTGGLGSDR